MSGAPFDVAHRETAELSLIEKTCPDCRGTRRPEGRGVIVAGTAAVDAARLIQVPCRLMDLGNTVLVIEHDLARPAGLAHRGVSGRTAPVGEYGPGPHGSSSGPGPLRLSLPR
ncbi:hypothetical protein [Streptomyces decoyicus]